MNTLFNIEVCLFNKIDCHFKIDNQIITAFPTADVFITFVHKTKFKNKLKRLTYSTLASGEPVVNGIPGSMSKQVGTQYTEFTLTIPTSIQNLDWKGFWSVCISVGTLDNYVFSVKAQNYIVFKEPILNLNYSSEIDCYISKISDYVFLGKRFILNSSYLNGPDLLTEVNPPYPAMYIYAASTYEVPTTYEELLNAPSYYTEGLTRITTPVMDNRYLWVAIPTKLTLDVIENADFPADLLYNKGPVPGVHLDESVIYSDYTTFSVYAYRSIPVTQCKYNIYFS